MKVISLFDGMSCARIALDRANIPVTEYYSSEIDKYAIQVSKANYPDIIQLGDVQDISFKEGEIDLLIGGSPCQGFSFAGRQLNFDDPRSKLFFEYVRILKESKPKYFLLENVRMKKDYQDVISDLLGVQPIAINSSLVSAQNRYRLYWTNIPGVLPPEDKRILMRDILEQEPKEFTTMSDKFVTRNKGSKCLVDNQKDKASNLSAMEYVKNGRQGDYLSCDSITGRPNLTDNFNGLLLIGYAEQIKGHGYNRRVYHPGGKAPSLCAASGGNLEPKVSLSEKKYRKLTPLECERLQTVPDNYTAHVSNTQRYKMLGNGFTVDVIAHILKGINHL